MATFPRTMLTQRIYRAAAVLLAATLASTLSIGLAPAASAAETVLRPLATFDDYANGSLRGQGPWSVNVAGAGDGAIASADVPAALSGKAMVNQLTGTGGQPVTYRGNAYAALGALAPAASATAATVFFEFASTRLAGTKLHLGLSADASPGWAWTPPATRSTSPTSARRSPSTRAVWSPGTAAPTGCSAGSGWPTTPCTGSGWSSTTRPTRSGSTPPHPAPRRPG